MRLPLFISLVCLFGCSIEREKKITQFDFNAEAKNSFIANFNSLDLSPMNNWKICILKEAVSNYLDSINNWKLTIVDSFYVRNYSFGDLGAHFSFVSNKKGEYYFIYLPMLYEFLVGSKYYQFKDGQYILKDSVELSIVKINSSMLDHFLEREVFVTNDLSKQYLQCMRLMETMFPEILYEETSISNFLQSLKDEPKKNQDYIMNSIDHIIARNENFSVRGKDVRIYNLNPFGFIILDFQSEQSPGVLDFNMYFMPHKLGYTMPFETEASKYRVCYEN